MSIASMAGAISHGAEKEVRASRDREIGRVRERHTKETARQNNTTREFIEQNREKFTGVLYDSRGFDELKENHRKMERDFLGGPSFRSRDLPTPEDFFHYSQGPYSLVSKASYIAGLMASHPELRVAGRIAGRFLWALRLAEWIAGANERWANGERLFQGLGNEAGEMALEAVFADVWGPPAAGYGSEKYGEIHRAVEKVLLGKPGGFPSQF